MGQPCPHCHQPEAKSSSHGTSWLAVESAMRQVDRRHYLDCGIPTPYAYQVQQKSP